MIINDIRNLNNLGDILNRASLKNNELKIIRGGGKETCQYCIGGDYCLCPNGQNICIDSVLDTGDTCTTSHNGNSCGPVPADSENPCN